MGFLHLIHQTKCLCTVSLHGRCLFVILLFLSSELSVGQDIQPALQLNTSGAVYDLAVAHDKLYLATEMGVVDVFSLETGQVLEKITIPGHLDFMGETIPSKIYSIDMLDDQLLLVSQGNHGFRNLIVIQEGRMDTLLSAKTDRMMIKKARFINPKEALLGLLSNELIRYNLERKTSDYRQQISPYAFSDFVLHPSGNEFLTADESGIIHRISLSDGKSISAIEGVHRDKVFQLSCQETTFLSAGQDRRLGVSYRRDRPSWFVDTDFLVYCVGVSPDGMLGAFTASEDNSVMLIRLDTQETIGRLVGHNSTLTKIVFLDNRSLITTAEEKKAFIWHLE